jgi:hypothetical protein
LAAVSSIRAVCLYSGYSPAKEMAQCSDNAWSSPPVTTSSGLLVTSALTWQVEERETYDRDQEVAGERVVVDVVAPDAAVGEAEV